MVPKRFTSLPTTATVAVSRLRNFSANFNTLSLVNHATDLDATTTIAMAPIRCVFCAVSIPAEQMPFHRIAHHPQSPQGKGNQPGPSGLSEDEKARIARRSEYHHRIQAMAGGTSPRTYPPRRTPTKSRQPGYTGPSGSPGLRHRLTIEERMYGIRGSAERSARAAVEESKRKLEVTRELRKKAGKSVVDKLLAERREDEERARHSFEDGNPMKELKEKTEDQLRRREERARVVEQELAARLARVKLRKSHSGGRVEAMQLDGISNARPRKSHSNGKTEAMQLDEGTQSAHLRKTTSGGQRTIEAMQLDDAPRDRVVEQELAARLARINLRKSNSGGRSTIGALEDVEMGGPGRA